MSDVVISLQAVESATNKYYWGLTTNYPELPDADMPGMVDVAKRLYANLAALLTGKPDDAASKRFNISLSINGVPGVSGTSWSNVDYAHLMAVQMAGLTALQELFAHGYVHAAAKGWKPLVRSAADVAQISGGHAHGQQED